MSETKRIGIIDIGSNSVRLVIYEYTPSVLERRIRVIDESKASVRLSGKVLADGSIPIQALNSLVDTLQHFKLLCSVNGAERIRATATAAIRNAANSGEIRAYLEEASGLHIEVLSGEDEARLGFLGAMQTLDMQEGFLLDIGGGSTELTLFRNRTVLESHSFPFGAVNMSKRFTENGELSPDGLSKLRQFISEELQQHAWAAVHPGLPLIGLGGTIRNICKIDQKQRKYSLAKTHQYEMDAPTVAAMLTQLSSLSYEQRKKVEGLSKDRVDLIVPGLTILHTIFEQIHASHYVVCGAGLRNGVFYESVFPGANALSNVLEHSVRNLISLHPAVSLDHVNQVNKLAQELYSELRPIHGYGEREATLLHAASLLYRIGISVDLYDYQKHTFYLIAHSAIYGLSHRETLMVALIASYKSKSRCKKAAAPYRDILSEEDLGVCEKLGTVLQLAVALDRSETQPIESMSCKLQNKQLALNVKTRWNASIEAREVEAVASDFKKSWKVAPLWREG
ncbi:Ppx/GppA family phosphatase [Xylanibacillus composti]|uniref:Phosphatase n=1 Tax=Xylanibacillus composti TaxID=1572762 RepID=A0A8J4H5E2_9BACL|nr:Ppx/GppA phosphatase family protein [Xylanibacillus composti]MDT9724795.1 Ppx/GppA family phosphatase [Xylanibacillus composti]GIQ69852.1 phosphatase [Xylanibacillus composti]